MGGGVICALITFSVMFCLWRGFRQYCLLQRTVRKYNITLQNDVIYGKTLRNKTEHLSHYIHFMLIITLYSSAVFVVGSSLALPRLQIDSSRGLLPSNGLDLRTEYILILIVLRFLLIVIANILYRKRWNLTSEAASYLQRVHFISINKSSSMWINLAHRQIIHCN